MSNFFVKTLKTWSRCKNYRNVEFVITVREQGAKINSYTWESFP